MKHRAMGGTAVHTGLSVRSLWLVVLVYGSAMALIVLWQSHRWEEAFATRAVDELASLVGVLVAAGCAAWAARSARSRARRGWLALAIGLLAWAVGGGLWCHQELWLRADDSLLHAMADGILLLFPLGAGEALLLLSIRDSAQSQSRLILDGVIVAMSLLIVSWVGVLDDVVNGGDDSRLIILMHLLVRTITRARDSLRASMALTRFASSRGLHAISRSASSTPASRITRLVVPLPSTVLTS